MALLRRARKDTSMAALVEAHRRHVEEEPDDEEEEKDEERPPPMRRVGRPPPPLTHRPVVHHHDAAKEEEDDDDEDEDEEDWPADAPSHDRSPVLHKAKYHRHDTDSDGENEENEENEEKPRAYGEQRDRKQRRSVRFSETDTVTCAGSDENMTPDSQGYREDNLQRHHDQQRHHNRQHGLYHYGPQHPGKQNKREPFYQYEESLNTGETHHIATKHRHGAGRHHPHRHNERQQRPAAKVSSALMKPMQMMRDRSSAQRRARLTRNNGGPRLIFDANGHADFTNTGGSGGGYDGGGGHSDDDDDDDNDDGHSQIDAKSVVADSTGLVKVDEKMIRYIDATLVKPNYQVFNRYTRFFLDRNLEKLYQEYTAINWFSRARWHILLLMLVHLLVLLLFSVLPPSGFKKMDQFILSAAPASTWMQWSYLFVAVPFAFLPRRKNPFQKRWRFWACLIVVLFNFTFQIWLSHAGQLALEQFSSIVENRLQCNAINTAPQNTMSTNVTNVAIGGSGSGSGSGSWAGVTVGSTAANTTKPLTPAQLIAKTHDQLQFIKVATYLYAGALTQILTGFAWLFSFIFVISIRLEFVYVMVVGFSAVITYMFVVFLFSIQIEWMTTFSYGFAVVLLFILSRSADLTNRRSFLSTFVVEKENEKLKSSLNKAEAALMNEPAGDEEKQVVEHVLDVPEMKALEIFRIPFADLKFLQAIGRGAMGDVIKAKYLGTMVVCKRIRRENITEAAIESFREEIVLMSCLRHPNIVQFIGASWDNYSNLCIVMEYLENGDMHSVLHSNIGKNFTWADPLLKMAIDVVQGMLYLHSQEPPIVHRDLKSVNVLCSATYGCNVGDFGLSRRYKKGVDALTTLVGTPFWLAPEIIRNDRYGPAADVYSFGIVLTELETRNTPYNELEENGLKVLMRIAHNNLRPTLPPTCLANRRKLITDCLLDEPGKRPTFAEILARLQGPVQLEIEEDATRATLLERRTTLLKNSTHAHTDTANTSASTRRYEFEFGM